ncbi:MAG TPA: protein-tyrosine-phosphatase [Stellaceae bacterium]|nr:protein-tyrosine-phosphatase [Stellaceae bacterium]
MDPASPLRLRTSICGIDEIEALGDAGVTHVLSLLDPGWPAPEALACLGGHERLDLRFHDIVDALPGLRRPGEADVVALLEFARGLAGAPSVHLLVHCQKGLSRSSAALALVMAQANPGLDADAVMADVMRLRPRAWPNLRIIELGDALLGRRGHLIAAVARCYRARIAVQPRIADAMIEMGRVRELDCALTLG